MFGRKEDLDLNEGEVAMSWKNFHRDLNVALD
jgi:hypothetical protein